MSITGGSGVNLIAEMLANVNLAKDLGMLAQGGRIVVIGNRGTIEINPRDAMAREAGILGLLLCAATDAELAEIHSAIAAGPQNGTLRPVIRQELRLADAPRSHPLAL